jgi:sarcosine oxidase, subunit beta
MALADVLIIGGGLTGCATAYHLARAGASVVLIEQGDINAGASGQNAGSLHFQIERRFLENGEAMAEQASQMVALNRLAIDEWTSLEHELGCDLEVAMGGGLMVAETPGEMDLLQRKAAREARWDLGTRLMDGDGARAIAPYLAGKIVGATYLAQEGHANPRSVTPAFARSAVAAGAVIMTQTALRSLEKKGSYFEAHAEKVDAPLTIRASQVLVAAGAWTAWVGTLVNLHLPVYAAGLTMNVTERTAPFMPHLIQHVGRRLSMKQAHNGNVLVGGGWPSRLVQKPEGGFDLSRRPILIDESVRGNLRAAVDTVPCTARLSLIRSWTGTVAITADQLPLLGEVPQLPGFYVAAGGSGFTLGPTFARFLARQMGGSDLQTEIFKIYSPERFQHLNVFMG